MNSLNGHELSRLSAFPWPTLSTCSSSCFASASGAVATCTSDSDVKLLHLFHIWCYDALQNKLGYAVSTRNCTARFVRILMCLRASAEEQAMTRSGDAGLIRCLSLKIVPVRLGHQQVTFAQPVGSTASLLGVLCLSGWHTHR